MTRGGSDFGARLFWARGSLAALVFAFFGCATDRATPHPEDFSRAPEGVLYNFGYAVGEMFAVYDFDESEMQWIAEGVRDAGLQRESRHLPLKRYRSQLVAVLQQRQTEIGELELSRSRPFLEAAASAEGAIVTDAGAILTIYERGEAEPPNPDQVVHVAYRAKLRDGTLARQSPEGKPNTTRLRVANRCWQEALSRVGRGARLRAICGPELVFGIRGQPGWFPPGAPVIWELELLDITDE